MPGCRPRGENLTARCWACRECHQAWCASIPGQYSRQRLGHPIKHQSNPIAPISCDGQTSLLMGGAGPLSPSAGGSLQGL